MSRGDDHLADRDTQVREQVSVLPILDQLSGLNRLMVDEYPRPLLTGRPGIVCQLAVFPCIVVLTSRSIFHHVYDSTRHRRPRWAAWC